MSSEPTKLDRRKEIRELQAENAALKEQVAQLEREKDYRYVEQVLRPMRILLKVAECAEAQFLVLYKDFYVRRYKIEVTSCIDVSPDLEEHSITEFKATVIAVLEKA